MRSGTFQRRNCLSIQVSVSKCILSGIPVLERLIRANLNRVFCVQMSFLKPGLTKLNWFLLRPFNTVMDN